MKEKKRKNEREMIESGRVSSTGIKTEFSSEFFVLFVLKRAEQKNKKKWKHRESEILCATLEWISDGNRVGEEWILKFFYYY